MKDKKFGNPDVKETARELTEAERKRLERFEALAEKMKAEGYRRTDLTISIVAANVFALVLFVPLFIGGMALFILKNSVGTIDMGPSSVFGIMIAMLVLIVVHELIHGLVWSIFAERGFKDIEFGFMVKYLTPYCTCGVPLSKGQYIAGALAPLVLLGIVPMIWGILAGSFPVLLVGIIMADSAAGDIQIVWQILRYKSCSSDVVYIDHPTQGGGVIFER
ncbi:MAG: DUF3267 domain-containing protein [Firmicutes bacterium]|nr:DUF3267 domain-containing protein [Bacillota bacterium]